MLIALSLQLVLASSATLDSGTEDEAHVLAPITVVGRRVANEQPATSYAAPVTGLRFDPQVNLQARGLAEGQADVTVRGGLFENTGFRLGAVTVFDPQTGHYAVDIPFDPDMLSAQKIQTGFDNGLTGFNASVATISYAFTGISDGGQLAAGLGTDSLRFLQANTRHSKRLANGKQLGAMLSVAGSSGDGTLPWGDHDFKRISAQLQWRGDQGETNLLLGYHDKFFGWPGAYTGFSSLPETDHTRLGLLLLDHRQSNARGWWELGAAYRWLDDDYDFDRRTVESGKPGSFEHATRSFSLGLAGKQLVGGLDWHFSGQLSADRLVRSTDLTHGDFNSRSYLALSLAPGRTWALGDGAQLELKGGLRLDSSNRDGSAVMPMFAIYYERAAAGGLNRFGLDFSRTSQLPGYTALNSAPRGLFGGNPDLNREYANTLNFSFRHENASWLASAAAWFRRDDSLVDWTFQKNAPFVRQANPVDIDALGLEAMLAWQSDKLEFIAAYAWIDKDADYGGATIDASFYALNFARHRLTLALIYRPSSPFELRLDNEYRRQQENPLRSGSDHAYLASLSLTWRPPAFPGTHFKLVTDNVTDNEFQEFPGTPATGRQVSLGIGLDW